MFKILKSHQAQDQVLQYEPQPIKMGAPQQALVFVHGAEESEQRNFELARIVAQNIGVDEIEKKSFREHIEAEVLAKLGVVQEKAYNEAYQLGLEDGRKKAYEDATQSIQASLSGLAALLDEITRIKERLIVENEAFVVRLLFYCAKNLALKEIAEDKHAIREVLKAAVENAQTDEKVVVRVNPAEYDFVDKLKGDPNPQFDKLRTIKLESDPGVSLGGCVIETNYGVIDASIEERVQKMWKVLESKIPNSKAIEESNAGKTEGDGDPKT